MYYHKNKHLPHGLKFKMHPFCHFRINNFILKTKATPKDNYYQFF